MSILVNKNTTGAPMVAVGKTGTQLVRFIPAPRVYVKVPDSTTAAPINNYITLSGGTTPSGWQDLGIISGVKITYDKQTQEVNTGLDQYLRGAYVKAKKCSIDFEAEQFDDVNIELLTGFTGVSAGSNGVNYQLGQEDLVQKAILIVMQNKLDSKEFQFYNPNAYLKFTFNSSSDKMTLAVNGILPSFTPLSKSAESFLSLTEFSSTTILSPSNTTNYLSIADSNSGSIYSIYFSNGTLEVGSSGGNTVGQTVKLTDTVTQSIYLLQISNGTLVATTTNDATGAVSSIQLSDVITSTTYNLMVASGSLVIA